MTSAFTSPFLMRSARGGGGNRLNWSDCDRFKVRVPHQKTKMWWYRLYFHSTRTYTVPDPPGLFDGHVWPMYLRHRKEMENNCDRIGQFGPNISLERLKCTTQAFKCKKLTDFWVFVFCFKQSTLMGWSQRKWSTTWCMKTFRTPCWTVCRWVESQE